MLIQKLPLLAIAMVAIGCTWATADDKASDTVIEKLQGRWQIVSGVNQGRMLSDAEVDGTFITVTTNTIITYDRDMQQRYRAVFRIDSSEDPIQITMTAVAADVPVKKPKLKKPHRDTIAPGILKFSGNESWTLCYALPGAERPEKFESPVGSKNMLFTVRKDQGDPVPNVSVTDPTNE